MTNGVRLIEIYKCLCDETRLRILHLLSHQPLCVCHFQAILRAPQVKISKHLAYLRERDLVHTRREGAWIIYSLPVNPPPELAENMRCLQDCCREQKIFESDLDRMAKALESCAGPLAECCPSAAKRPAGSRRRNGAHTSSRNQ
jgi:ArsR family transcriptional regulator